MARNRHSTHLPTVCKSSGCEANRKKSKFERYRLTVTQAERFGRVNFHSNVISTGDGDERKEKWVHFRWACPKFLRQSFHEWAGHSISQSTWARAYYKQQRGRGKDHHAAVRALAFKWIRILFRCWQDRAAYDENKYLVALAKRGSPLSSVLTVTTAAV